MRKQGDGYVIRSEESITLMTPYGGLSIYLLTVADSSHSFIMTPCRFIQGSWSRPSERAAGTRSAIEDTRLS